MTKKLTNADVLAFYNKLMEMHAKEEKTGESIFKSIKVNFAIRRNKEKLLPILRSYEESRQEIVKKYKDENSTDEKIQIKIECAEQYSNDMNELLNIENEVDIHSVAIDALSECNLTMSEMDAIYFMIEE